MTSHVLLAHCKTAVAPLLMHLELLPSCTKRSILSVMGELWGVFFEHHIFKKTDLCYDKTRPISCCYRYAESICSCHQLIDSLNYPGRLDGAFASMSFTAVQFHHCVHQVQYTWSTSVGLPVLVSQWTQHNAIVKWGKSSPKASQWTPRSLPVRVRYGVSFLWVLNSIYVVLLWMQCCM